MKKTTTIQLVLAWAFVGIPLAVGIIQTLLKSLALFK
ncbi:MAG: oxalate:formate antiporter [Saprospiraceae bacterium]|nr:oxalate:formate antiporter [Saprospiraceae bacterium]